MHRNSQHHLVGKAVVDTYLRRIGWVSGALFEDGSSHPVWLLITCGRSRRRAERLVPAHEAFDREQDVYISYSKHMVHNAPLIAPSADLVQAQDAALAYYRLPQLAQQSETTRAATALPAAA